MNEIINYLNIHSKWNNKQPQQQKSSVKCQRTHPHHAHTHTHKHRYKVIYITKIETHH